MINFLFGKNICAKSFLLEECGGWRCPNPQLDNFKLALRGWHNDETLMSPLPLIELHGWSQKNT